MTRKHPFEMQKVRKDLFLSLNISEIRKYFFVKHNFFKDQYFDFAL